MRGASKVLCIISGIIDLFLVIGAVVYLFILNEMRYTSVGETETFYPGSPMYIAALVLCALGAFIALIAAIFAFSASGGRKGACIATIVFGFMGQNILAIIGGILGVIACNRENK